MTKSCCFSTIISIIDAWQGSKYTSATSKQKFLEPSWDEKNSPVYQDQIKQATKY